ncbi:D-aminoacylase [Fusobacterium necrophorum]|uniref:N-acyl-D-amino-acid deacylase family protein n=1 Tax=Fusobacterium necrophorum TaxID=859 RepID=UPI00254B52D4|nr:D-aminoacylase [Fusobacterium necrophorum]MDK4471453.1 D-aminoacylase [Fusobacterium necrophorum]MDK4478188.1 D-aminoacylase [Fusobacterium necrophorum]MDK4518122.1 D-aminoacylase [Fusobacterium necrophorum]
MSTILIKNGTLIDGTGNKRYSADILIENEKIKKIGKLEINADMIIDISGKIVSPGFIDTHSHSDLKVLLEPFVEPKIRQGITTEILGQDGISMAPLPKQYVNSWRKNLAGLDGDSDELKWDWENTNGYLNLISHTGSGPNELYLVPHGNIRMEAMGLEARAATKEEIEKMKQITRREMEAGVAGISTGLIYIPCAYAETEELIEICKVVAEYGRPLVIHQRSEADTMLESMQEVIRIAKESGIKIHFSHFKICGQKNWKLIEPVIALLDKCKEEGIHISYDQYPYVAGSTMLGVILPPWAHAGGTDKLIERLQDETLREKMKEDIINGIPGWDNFIDFAGFDGIYVTSVKTSKNQDCIGKNLTEIAAIRAKEKFDAVFDLLVEEENAVGMYDYYEKDEHVETFMKRPESNICTDGLLGGKPHPRVYGSFPRVLGKFVREMKTMSLEEAIYKMTHKPAVTFKIKNRGLLKENYFADIVIFDEDKIIDKGTFIEPTQFPDGIDYVLVNGKFAVKEGRSTYKLNGKIIKID